MVGQMLAKSANQTRAIGTALPLLWSMTVDIGYIIISPQLLNLTLMHTAIPVLMSKQRKRKVSNFFPM
jgi:hypothetical protein